ncbi:IS5 family transposase [Paracoccus sp. (in: a-proteobacteria)]|uniref:IS5 family transposase n=1 Tax=Paracoccus sp. TaxID=267 RepID=UPI0026E07BA4|nr:IS5 family transposase [Paracoccus sp. (in: a-proteobacteria)]MDO5370888.1 IS5 family transposase [Paracoccus sp. (in: a-proteobacteria)]
MADLRACAPGRSRGGLTTRIHAVTEARGLPIALKLTAGHAHHGRSADDMPDTVGAGQTLIADAAHDGNRLRERLAALGAKAVIRPIPRRSDPLPLDRAAYRRRDRFERFFSKLKHHRAVATRCEKHNADFLALVKLAATRIWLRACESVS